ncbi:ABC transporter permease [Clostridium fallax]|uniref:ABC-2 family transporter protein n=1 Tax=Clostridium fallax TaxID=1533 RepID=A0A1M4SLB8_9CLOT|nr:ABC transporter permease [Clostridium fallax]SHE33010.1 ABC-2 family transporter protein [Clostridium fallax]SQB07878.1 ABC transporter permease [Clostridium fallax]
MKNLFLCEWQRFWKRKTTVLCFLLSIVVIVVSVIDSIKFNKSLNIADPQYISLYKFPLEVLQKKFILVFNIILIFLIILSVTEEFRNRTIRMVLIRPIKMANIFLSKFLVIAAFMFLFLMICFIGSYLAGYFIFPKINKISLLYYVNTLNGIEMLLYSLKYYLILFLTLIAFSQVIFFIAIISKSTVIATGISIGFLLFSLMYPTVIGVFFREDTLKTLKIKLLSLTEVQINGIQAMIPSGNNLFWYISLIILGYIFIFFSINYFIYKKSDKLV